MIMDMKNDGQEKCSVQLGLYFHINLRDGFEDNAKTLSHLYLR